MYLNLVDNYDLLVVVILPLPLQSPDLIHSSGEVHLELAPLGDAHSLRNFLPFIRYCHLLRTFAIAIIILVLLHVVKVLHNPQVGIGFSPLNLLLYLHIHRTIKVVLHQQLDDGSQLLQVNFVVFPLAQQGESGGVEQI